MRKLTTSWIQLVSLWGPKPILTVSRAIALESHFCIGILVEAHVLRSGPQSWLLAKLMPTLQSAEEGK